jgi:RNA-directed DNA polymerase
VRYMDDMILWHHDLGQLRAIQQRCSEFARDGLRLELKSCDVRRTSAGMEFLGCRLWPTHVELSRRSKRRWRSRVKVLARAERLGLISESELQVRLSALTAFAKGAGVKSWRFRQSVLQRSVVDDQEGLEPGEPWRQLEQRRGELPDGEPQHERTDEPHEQQRLSPGPEFRW